MRKGRTEDALRVSGEAVKALAGDRRILLLRAVVLEQAGRTGEAQGLLVQIQNRWPEWQAAWTADGIILGTHGHRAAARAALETALALGAHSPEVQRYFDEIS